MMLGAAFSVISILTSFILAMKQRFSNNRIAAMFFLFPFVIYLVLLIVLLFMEKNTLIYRTLHGSDTAFEIGMPFFVIIILSLVPGWVPTAIQKRINKGIKEERKDYSSEELVKYYTDLTETVDSGTDIFIMSGSTSFLGTFVKLDSKCMVNIVVNEKCEGFLVEGQMTSDQEGKCKNCFCKNDQYGQLLRKKDEIKSIRILCIKPNSNDGRRYESDCMRIGKLLKDFDTKIKIGFYSDKKAKGDWCPDLKLRGRMLIMKGRPLKTVCYNWTMGANKYSKPAEYDSGEPLGDAFVKIFELLWLHSKKITKEEEKYYINKYKYAYYDTMPTNEGI